MCSPGDTLKIKIVHRNIVHNNPKMQIAQMPLSMEDYVTFMQWNTNSNEIEQAIAICNNMDEAHKLNV